MYILPEKPTYFYYDFSKNLSEDSYFISSNFLSECYKYRLLANYTKDTNSDLKKLIGNFFIDNNQLFLLESSCNLDYITNNSKYKHTFKNISRLF